MTTQDKVVEQYKRFDIRLLGAGMVHIRRIRAARQQQPNYEADSTSPSKRLGAA